MQRIEHRVSVKRSLVVKFEQELAGVQMVAGRGTTRQTTSSQMPVSYVKIQLLLFVYSSLCVERQHIELCVCMREV